jgi:hypothetical protein
MLLAALLEDPRMTNREAGSKTGLPESTVRRLRGQWAERYGGIDNRLSAKEEGMRLQMRRAERQ